MFARKPGKGITLEMYIRNTQVNKKRKEKKRNTQVNKKKKLKKKSKLFMKYKFKASYRNHSKKTKSI